jgi:2,5-diketo-D-gluconate reductase A
MAMNDATHGSATLRTGAEMPLLGFGTWRLEGKEARDSVRSALEVGYRHIDTATGYQNESEVGAALQESGVPREEVFVTTKCPPERVGRERETIEASLAALGTEWVDLWLVHWPPNGQATPAMWREFVQVAAEGKARAIGVSNYSAAQIDELVEATGVGPAVNQIPWSPVLHDPVVFDGLRRREVVLEGYSPFKRSHLDDPVLVEIAGAHGVTPAQVVLRWHLELGIVVIPKAAHRPRIEENFAVYSFTLSPDEVTRISGLGHAPAR